MTVEEFLNKTENMVIVDYDLDKETGYVEVKFGRNTGGSINYVFENNGVIILSSTPKDSNPRWYETAHQLDLSEIRDFCKGYENLELYYYSKSNGIFPVESVRRIEYDYSDDGDGHYEACHIECSENPVAKSLDNIEKINVDDYEDFFESLNKFNESTPSVRALRFKISNCLTYDKRDSGREQWEIDEDIEFDKALGIGLDKSFSFSELKSVINELPEKMENYFKEHNEHPNRVNTECMLNEIRDDSYWRPACIVKIDKIDTYETGNRIGNYIELFIQFDYKSLEQAFN
jgi:hypothetical protein